jgi:hypothetical protein
MEDTVKDEEDQEPKSEPKPEFKEPEIRRGPPKGWKCAKNGHIADEDFPTGGPVVKTTQGVFYAFPTGRCIACECVFTLKQAVAEPTKLVKADGSPQPDVGGLIKP